MMEALLYVFCTTLPCHILPVALFENSRWRSRPAALALVSLNVLCKMGTAAYCFANGLNYRNWELVFAAIGFLIYCCFLRLSPFKLFFTYLLIVDYVLIVRGVASFLAMRIFHASIQGWSSSFASVLLYVASMLPLFPASRRVIDRISLIDAPRLWRTIWLIPALPTTLTLLFTNAYQKNSVESTRFLFCRLSLLVSVFTICSVLLQSLHALERQAALRQQLKLEAHLLEVQLAEQKRCSQMMADHAEQLRRQRHDLRHQLTAIRGLADGTPESLKAYIDSLLDAIPSSPQPDCENQAVNALVSHYAALCQDRGVETEIRLSVPTRVEQISDGELCVLFGTLLENAVEACGRMAGGKRFLRLNSAIHPGALTITMDNSFDGQIRLENGRYRSSKRDDFGIGLASIQATVRKCGGSTRFEMDGGVFRSSVYVPYDTAV